MGIKQEPRQYLIFIFDDFKNREKIIELIALQLSPLTDEKSHVKYNYGDYGVVINLQTHISFYDFRDYVHNILEKVASQYFLIETPKNIFAYMPPELKMNLFDLTGENNIPPKKDSFKGIFESLDRILYELPKNIDIENFIFDDDKFDDIVKNVFGQNEKKQVIKPSIDDVLEKIHEKGLNSLTEIEKTVLDEYSKK